MEITINNVVDMLDLKLCLGMPSFSTKSATNMFWIQTKVVFMAFSQKNERLNPVPTLISRKTKVKGEEKKEVRINWKDIIISVLVGSNFIPIHLFQRQIKPRNLLNGR